MTLIDTLRPVAAIGPDGGLPHLALLLFRSAAKRTSTLDQRPQTLLRYVYRAECGIMFIRIKRLADAILMPMVLLSCFYLALTFRSSYQNLMYRGWGHIIIGRYAHSRN